MKTKQCKPLMESPLFANWQQGWLYHPSIQKIPSENYDLRPENTLISLLVIHAISLPPNQFGGKGVEQLFLNQLDPEEHPYYQEIHHLRVSAHFFIRRNGHIIQFVSTDYRAWHAGRSVWRQQEACNDFSIGIELEGSDFQKFEEIQYVKLAQLSEQLLKHFPIDAIIGHQHIAPLRKTDPGEFFNWQYFTTLLPNIKSHIQIGVTD